MSNTVALIGTGSMGTRYAAIMDYLNIPYKQFDEHTWRDVWMFKDEIHSIILASPTDCHYENLKYCARVGVPILCEKPVAKDPEQLLRILDLDIDIKCVNQYQYLVDPFSEGDTYYNYFRTGQDGLEWDCISIIALAKKPPHLMNSSPVWQCTINGKELSLADMDKAYVDMIRDWYRNPIGDKNYIAKAHDRVMSQFYVID